MAEGTFKGWIPEFYLDESVPSCRPTPSDWIVRGDVLYLAAAEDEDDPEIVLSEGEVHHFSGLTTFPPISVTWHGPGSYIHTPIPAEATCFWVHCDMDTFASSLGECLSQLDEYGELEAGQTIEVDCYDWSEAAFVLRDGAFHEVRTYADGN